VEAIIAEFFDRGLYRLVFDLQGVKFVSSAGFSAFLNAVFTATGNDGDVVFLGTPAATLQLLKALGLGNSLRFAENEREALACFGP
jgi:anti-anti-sigma factor